MDNLKTSFPPVIGTPSLLLHAPVINFHIADGPIIHRKNLSVIKALLTSLTGCCTVHNTTAGGRLYTFASCSKVDKVTPAHLGMNKLASTADAWPTKDPVLGTDRNGLRCVFGLRCCCVYPWAIKDVIIGRDAMARISTVALGVSLKCMTMELRARIAKFNVVSGQVQFSEKSGGYYAAKLVNPEPPISGSGPAGI
jgi:hypothetical protein